MYVSVVVCIRLKFNGCMHCTCKLAMHGYTMPMQSKREMDYLTSIIIIMTVQPYPFCIICNAHGCILQLAQAKFLNYIIIYNRCTEYGAETFFLKTTCFY